VTEPAATTITTTLDAVGPRLRKVREQRGVTLTEVATRTGMSKSMPPSGSRVLRPERPVVAAPAPVAPPTRPVAAVRHASAAPTAAFWLAMVVLAVLLIAASLVLGDPTPTAAVVTRSRLDRVLRDRAGETLIPSSL